MSQKSYMFEFDVRKHMIKKWEVASNNAKGKVMHSCLILIEKELIISNWQSRVVITLNIPKH